MGYIGATPTAVPLTGADILDDSIESADIKAGTIVNSDINANAAIVTSKVSGAVTAITSHGLATSATTDTTNADNIGSGTLPDARFPATLPAKSGVNLTALNATQLTSGTVANARISASSVTQHVATQIGFSNVSSWADSAVETLTLSTAAAGIGKAQVAVYEEIPDVNKTNATWNITTNDTGFNLVDSAYAQTLTPAATTGSSIAFTMGGGSWVTADIGKRIVNVSTSEAGEARIISIASAVATCVITTTFTDTNAIASGDWELLSAEFVDGKFKLSNATVPGGSNITGGTTYGTTPTMNAPQIAKLTSTTALEFTGGPGYTVSARVLTITGNVISFGTQITVQAFGGSANNMGVTALTSTLCIATWRGSSGYPKAVALTVSGTTVTAGSILNIENTNAGYDRVSALSSTTAIAVYNNSSQYGRAVVLTVSGTTVSAGTIITFESAVSIYIDVAALTSTKAIVVFRDGGNSLAGTARVLTISGTTVSAGASVTYNTLNASHNNIAKLSSTKAIVVYQDADSAPTNGMTCVLTQSGTTVTAGTSVTHDTGSTLDTSIAYISDDKVLITYKDTTNTRGVALVIEVSGTVPSPKTKFEFYDGDVEEFSCAALTANKLILLYKTGHIVLDLEEATYLTNQYVTTISGTDSVDTSYYSDWNSNTITETITEGTSIGALVTFESGTASANFLTRLTDTTAVITYQDSVGIKVAVLTISGTVLTIGAKFAPTTSGTNDPYLARLSDTQVVLTARGSHTYAQVLNISGTTITGSTEVTAMSGVNSSYWVAPLSATQVLAAGIASNVGKSVVLDISGSTITVGTNTNFAATANGYMMGAVLSSSKAIIGYQISSGAVMKAVVVDIASSAITAGAVHTIHTGTAYWASMTNIDATSAVMVFRDMTGGNRGSCYPMSVSGTTITTGTKVVFESQPVYENIRVENLSATQAIVSWIGQAAGASAEREVRYSVLNYASNVITADSVVTVNTDAAAVSRNTICALTSTKLAVAWKQNTPTSDGQMRLVDLAPSRITTAYYAFSVNSTPSAAEITGGTFLVVGSGQTATRNIVSSLNSVHGGTAGVWYKNTNATYGSATWVAATTNEAKAAIQEATATAANQMTGTAFAAISDANLPAFGTQISVAMTLYSTDNTVTSSIDGVSFNYDGNVLNRLETDVYIVEMPSTGSIKVTAPSSGGPRNARVYVSG